MNKRMKSGTYDPGLGAKLEGVNNRIIDKEGRFNISRQGQEFSLRDVFQHLINISWPLFLVYILGAFFILNSIFAIIYVWVGIEGLQGASLGSFWHEFKQAFFFSIQTSATVGYGFMAPTNDSTNIISSIETILGLLSFSIATGLFYGRFSRPKSAIIYSDNALIAPFKEGYAWEFKIVNRRSDTLMDVEARTVLTFLEQTPEGNHTRKYLQLPLQISQVAFMPLTWTLVHEIGAESPLAGFSKEYLEQINAEVLIQIKAFDETYNQTIYSRYSYPAREWIWGAKFKPSFVNDPNGATIVSVDKISEYEPLTDTKSVLLR